MAHDTAKRAAARDITEKCGYAAAALTIIPIPGTEILAVMPIHVGMVVAIGDIYEVPMTREGATELIMRIGATVGASLIGSRIATTAAKFVLPGLGGLISAPFMFASTLAIGSVAVAWFEAGGALDDDAMKNVYKEAASRAKSAFDPEKARSAEAREMAEAAAEGEAVAPTPQEDAVERLEKLAALLDKGLIDQGEYDDTKARILAEL